MPATKGTLALSIAVYFNFLTPKAEARPSGDKGWGSFAIEPIEKGEILATFGGAIVNRAQMATMSADRQARSVQVDDDCFVLGPPEREPGDSVNHSCDPNGGMKYSVQVVAMRRIEPGEELSFDYSAINTANTYQRVVLIFDLGTAGDGSANFTYYFDDITVN